MSAKDTLLGKGYRKIQPKLRMVANGDAEVNSVRADFNPAVRMMQSVDLRGVVPGHRMTARSVLPAERERAGPKRADARADAPPPTPEGLDALSKEVTVSVFVETDAPVRDARIAEAVRAGATQEITAERGRLATAEVCLADLPKLAAQREVVRIEMGETLKRPRPTVTKASFPAPAPELLETDADGVEGPVLIGIIDVGGFDFAHSDFGDDQGGTRFVSIWDQGGEVHPSPDGFLFGSEITKSQMDTAIQSSEAAGLAPQLLEPQSVMEHASHGTHVASIAAGNSGACPSAFIAGVLVNLPREDFDRRKSFYDSTRVALGVEYILGVAERLKQAHGLETLPVAINVSLGTNGHAHDGSSAVSRWIENVLATPGIAVCVAAGNAGQEAPEHADDAGFIMGRIHTSGTIAAQGLVNEIDWVVVGNGVVDISENELEVWYSASDRFAVSVKPPGQAWINPVEPGQFIENRQLADATFVSIYNEIYHPANGANYIGIYLSPFFSETELIGVTPGVWRIRLHGRDVRDGRYHAWIERDDPDELGPIGEATAWRFPSFFSESSNVDESSVSSLGCGEQTICVANLDEQRQRINITSSQGPTRVGDFKPDLAAPGTEIVAALGFNFDNDEEWVAMTGTSMASPYVCGATARMLARNPRLTAAQIRGVLHRTAKPLPNADFSWRNDAGYGVIDLAACLAEVDQLSQVQDVT